MVEVFLVAALLGMVLLAIFSTYNAGIRIWRSIKELKLVEDRRFFIAIEKIRKELMGYIRDFDDISFEGDDKEGLSFPSISNLDIVKVTYHFDKNRDGLLRKVVRFSDSLKDKMEERTTELFDADDVQLYYLFYDAGEETGDWITCFTEEEEGIPEAIRFDITRKGEKFSEYVFLPQ